MNKQIIQEALTTVKKFGYIVERGEFNDPSNRPEFYDPDYGWDGRDPEYNHDEDDYEARCANDKELITNFLKEKYPNINCIVDCYYDINGENVKFILDMIFKFDELPTQEQIDECDIINETAAEVSTNICWDEGDGVVLAVDKNGKTIKDLSNCFWYSKNKQIPTTDLNADHYELHEYWFYKDHVDPVEYEDDRW